MNDKISSNSIIPAARNPYYIVSPSYTRLSAGVTVLHMLCHFLNTSGRSAYMVHYPQLNDDSVPLSASATLQKTGDFPAGMIAPLITQQVIDAYDELQLTPIVIYPEIFDNLFDAPFFGRYFLNYPGLLGPIPTQDPNFAIAYTHALAEKTGATDILYMCTSDLLYWNTSGGAEYRTGSCYYAGKTQVLMGADMIPVPNGSVEITRAGMTRDEIRHLFWQSEMFYCFEDTALATEAQLCGCPVVFVPTEYFSGAQLARVELGDDGACLLGEPDGLGRAQRTVGAIEARVRATFAEVPRRVVELAEKIEVLVRERPYQGTIRLPSQPRLVYFEPSLETTDIAAGAAANPPHVDLASIQDELAAAHADLGVMHTDLAATLKAKEQLENAIMLLRSSTSWRSTAPLRRLVVWWRSLKSRRGLSES